MKPKLFWLLFGLILLLATVLRFYKLGAVPAGLYWDEIAMLVDAKSVAQTGHDMHGGPWYQLIYPSYGDYKLPVYIWLASVSVKLFGVSEWALRLPSALAGVATVIFAGLIAKKLWTMRSLQETKVMADAVQLFTMLVVAISPWSMMFSRTGFEGHVAQLLVAISVYLLLCKQWRYLFLAAVFGILATYTYFSVRFVWPVVFLATTIFAFRKQLLSLKLISHVLVPLAFFGLLLIPMSKAPFYRESNQFRLSTTSILNDQDYALQSNIYRELAGNTPLDRILFHRDVLLVRELAKNYADHLNLNFLFVSGDRNLRHGTGEHGLFLLPFIIPFGIGLFYLATKRKDIGLVLLVWWLIALLPASVPETTPHALRSLNALVPLSVIIGIGVAHGFSIFYIDTKKILSRTFVIVFIFTAVLFTGQFIYHYFVQYRLDSAVDWQAGYTGVAKELLAVQAAHPGVETQVGDIDDIFYLWLMAYGPYTATDFPSWPQKDFKFERVDSIQTDSHLTVQKPGTYVIATKEGHFNELLSSATVLEIHQLADISNNQKYVVAVIRVK